MIWKSFFCVVLSIFFFKEFPLEAGRGDLLSKKNIRQSVEEMLEHHVEYKVFSPFLAKRSFKLFLEQFDPNKMYLLQSEALFFSNISDESLEQVVFSYQRGDYSLYDQVDKLIRSSIIRAKSLREKIREEILSKGDFFEMELEVGAIAFAKTEDVLIERIKRRILHVIRVEKEAEGIVVPSKEELIKLLDLFERRAAREESFYFSEENREHFFCMHVLKSIAKSLDAHTSFFSPEEAHELRSNLEKQFDGVGVILREGIYGIVIKGLVHQGPAEKSGRIDIGDVLLAVDGRSVDSVSYHEVMKWLKGAGGERVSLTLKKKEGQTVRVDLMREKIVMKDGMVRFDFVPYADGIIGIIEVPAFYEGEADYSCDKDIKEALRKLRKEGKVYGVILDMRNNSGGFLSQAVKVAGLFISSGVIVISKYAQGQMQYLREVDGKIFYEGPLVLLTSKASASAAEIVAQALQDYGLALVVGDERTYGKGTIQYQTVTEEGASSYFKVTVGRYYTVSGKSTQIEGVKADIVVPTKYAPFNIGEKYLLYALKNDQVASAFADSLLDVEVSNRAWMKKNYLPNLQKKNSFWTEVLPILQTNSQCRLSRDRDFLCFLRFLQKDPMPSAESSSVLSNFGLEDLQTSEAINIIKDMSLLQKYKKNQLNPKK